MTSLPCSDRAAVMTKVGRVVDAEQQLFYAHAIQLAVLDVLYKNIEKNVGTITMITVPEPEAYTDDETDDEEDNSGSAFEVIDDDSDIIAEISDSYP